MNKISSYFSALAGSVLATAVALLPAACSPDDNTDNGDFMLYYESIVDIGPSTNFNLTPSWHGGTPSDFEITKVTCNDSAIQSDSFSIDSETGEFSLHDTDDMEPGVYKVSVSCKAGGDRHNFEDAITINMMKAVPDGISVEPSVLTVTLADVISGSSDLPTAQVSTSGDHVSITGYYISTIRKDGEVISDPGLFKISSSGLISIVANESAEPGEYVLDLKLTTYLVGQDSEDGIFSNALTVNITSAPLALTYDPAVGKVEQGYGFKSVAPVLTGSKEGLVYTLKSTSPEEASISVVDSTGVIVVDSTQTIPVGTSISVSVTATNEYGSTDFDDVYTITAVEYIAPITTFSYNDLSDVIETSAFSNPVAEMDGLEVTYSFVDLDTNLTDLKINQSTGEVYAEKGNSIPAGEYTVTVRATNNKGSMDASFKLTVIENPYMFTYVSWGNNLGLSPVTDYASQYRLMPEDDSLVIPIVESDLPAGQTVTYSLKRAFCKAAVSIDENGTITVQKSSTKRVDFVYITVTCGGDDPNAVSKVIPVFFHHATTIGGIQILYTPFVFQCNPVKGGKSAAPTITGNTQKIGMDFRRSFNYINLAGPESHISGAPSVSGGFLNSLWTTYFTAKGEAVNTGKREPMSYWDSKVNAQLRLGYTDPDDYSVVINPGKFRTDDGYANGVFVGQQIFGDNGGVDPSTTNDKQGQIFMCVWFDTDF